MARNAFALALLTAIALGGCSTIKGALQGDKEEKAAEAKIAALRARTDSLRKARRLADSLAQVRYTVCADSVRVELNKPPVVTKAKAKKKRRAAKFVPPSEQVIASKVQAACADAGSAPHTTVATADTAAASKAAADTARPKPQAGTKSDSARAPRAAAADSAPASAPPAPVAPTPLPTVVSAPAPMAQDSAAADSAQKRNEMDLSRETFAYSGAARDPFNSLLNMAKAGPELADLQLVGIYQNLRAPSASIAVFREKDGGKRHKLRAGDQVGRSRLVQIRDREAVFIVEDFGFERQETLSLRKQEDVAP
ncbi:MAG TPA: hypothetical protein VD930_05405 [Gemmatimonadales bacterium]|nr:hypothetical protein [Gemmatimonadales bacterium]